jgi:hypothetical protein
MNTSFKAFASVAPRVLAGLLALMYSVDWLAGSRIDTELEQYSSPAFRLLAFCLSAFLVRLIALPNRGRLVFGLTLLCGVIETAADNGPHALAIWCWVVCLLISWDLPARSLSYAVLSPIGAILILGHPTVEKYRGTIEQALQDVRAAYGPADHVTLDDGKRTCVLTDVRSLQVLSNNVLVATTALSVKREVRAGGYWARAHVPTPTLSRTTIRMTVSERPRNTVIYLVGCNSEAVIPGQLYWRTAQGIENLMDGWASSK